MDDPKLFPPPETEKRKFPWRKVGEVLGIVAIVLVVAAFLTFIVYKAVTDEPDWKRAARECREACPTYNAEFVRVMETPRHDYECWCRRGTDPLRIW